MPYQYLSHIDSPADLKKVPRVDLPRVAEEMRDHLISVVIKPRTMMKIGEYYVPEPRKMPSAKELETQPKDLG